MTAFLAMHVIYTWMFITAAPAGTGRGGWMPVIPVIAGAGGFLFRLLFPGLGRMRIPVFLYLVVVSIMVMAAVRLAWTVPGSGWPVAVGAVLFMISDSLLAIRIFGNKTNRMGGWVTGTYLAAQWFIASGLLSHWR